MKKALSLILALALMLCAVSSAVCSAETASSAYPFTQISGEKSTGTLTGDAVSGYTAEISGEGRTLYVSDESVPINSLMFEYGYSYSGNTFGQFGVALTKEAVTESSIVNENILVFHYRVSGGKLYINLPNETGDESGREIAYFTSSDRRDDAFWGPNISSFGFVKGEDGHWYLSVDGLVCNLQPEIAALDKIIGSSIFEYGGKVYPFFGGYNSGTAYYKLSSKATPDNAISLITNDSYGFMFNGPVYEWRGQGFSLADSRSRIERYDFPKYVSGDKATRHEIDFTNTAGFAQTTQGFDLKTTTFKLSAVTYDGNTSPLYYDFGFTTDPTAAKHHDTGNGETIEFRATSVYGDNYTWLHNVTGGGKATPDYGDAGRGFYWKTTRYEANKEEYTWIDFVQEVGNDGQQHWYMRSWVGGTYATVTAVNFDNIIDKPVYFRFGANSKSENSFKMLLQVVEKQADGSYIPAWEEESNLPIISASQEKARDTVLDSLAVIGGTDAESIKAEIAAAVALRDAYLILNDDAKQHLYENEIADAEAIVAFLDNYVVLGDLNGDYIADTKDLNLIRSNWLNGNEYNADYDLNEDGLIDIMDVLIYLSTYL